MMKKITCLSVLFLFLVPVSAQNLFVENEGVYPITKLLHVGMNYSPDADKFGIQLHASTAYPWLRKNRLELLSGVDYTSNLKGAELCGFQLKPVNAYYSVWGTNWYTFSIGSSVGYMINTKRHYDNGWVITPNLKFEIPLLTAECGYGFDVTNGYKQFNIRLSMSLSAIGYFVYMLSH